MTRWIGRWALPSGQTFRVLRYHDERRALCGNGDARWLMLLRDLARLSRHGHLRYLGR